MNTRNHRTLLAALLTAAVVALSGAAQAGGFSGETTMTKAEYTAQKWVSYGDLDLNSPEGRQVLAARISEAARDVCGPTDYRMTGSLKIASLNRSCVSEAYDDAMSRVSSGSAVAVRD